MPHTERLEAGVSEPATLHILLRSLGMYVVVISQLILIRMIWYKRYGIFGVLRLVDGKVIL